MSKKNATPYEMIETRSDLEKFADQIAEERFVAVDLEADSMYHFRERVCLLQIATRNTNVLIDPLKIDDLSCLSPTFSAPEKQKIFHGADYDIRSLYRDFGLEISNLFDTQLACRFLGFQETGLEAVLQKFFNVSLNKKYQKKDWSQRPLSPEMMKYAAQDAIYLIPLAQKLQERLDEKKRMNWVSEDCHLLSKVRAISHDQEPLFLRFRGAGRLKPRTLAVLESLLQMRQEIAEKKDRPPFKVLGNASLIKIAEIRPITLNRLEQTGTLSRKQLNMYGGNVIQAVKEALKLSESELPRYPRKRGPILSPKVPDRVKALKQWRDRRAEALEIDPALICNKSLMTTIAARNPKQPESLCNIEEMREWQKEVFGREIIGILQNGNIN
ncbi:ribonuclease D [Desulfonema ishimotonii]|uniref:Ribonuclease D n=1 Tax=Desulfonema ishimotonii TaxID=45657 RepID=A0A401G4C0_9BACT|nr:ribonuclease D [Desulfonema ishimotonii]GBC64088.1 ribonuclease D [Desulfonema ishimotonii]